MAIRGGIFPNSAERVACEFPCLYRKLRFLVGADFGQESLPFGPGWLKP